jgi:recombinational DNA repair ATPase RecF
MEKNKEDVTRLNRVLEELADHERRISKIERALGPKSKFSVTKQSVRELLILKKPRTDIGKTLVVGYHVEFVENISPFNTNDLVVGFAKAKEPLSSNLSQMVNENIKKGYMEELAGKKGRSRALHLTNSGAKRVEDGFLGDVD